MKFKLHEKLESIAQIMIFPKNDEAKPATGVGSQF